MKNAWSQPSLSRDFAMLAAAILFVLFLISAWVSYATYLKHTKFVSTHLELEATRIEKLLAHDMNSANYMLTSIGKQIIQNKNYDLTSLAQFLKSFDNRGYIYSVFSYINDQQKVIVSSNRGVIDKPVDISDRDYILLSQNDPWKMHIGAPIDGRVSGRWVIPVSMGISDSTGKFVGTVLISLDINLLMEEINKIVSRDGISFSILSNKLVPLMRDSEATNLNTDILQGINLQAHPNGMASHGSLFFGTNIYSYYYSSPNYPYVILINYDSSQNDESVRNQLWSRLLQVLGFAAFFVLFLWIMRARIINPIIYLTDSARDITKGKLFKPTPQGGAVEIDGLSAQMGAISEYISEKNRIEDELRNKMFLLKKDKERSDMERKIQTEFLSYICQELRTPANEVMSFAKVMKDQLYGPIENRKYRQYASDIYQSSSQMLGNLNDLLSFSKIRDEYAALEKSNIDIASSINKAVEFTSDKLSPEARNIKLKAQDSLPKLIIAPFSFQQIIANLLSYATKAAPDGDIIIDARIINENKDNPFVVIAISSEKVSSLSQHEISVLAERILDAYQHNRLDEAATTPLDGNLSLELAKALITGHHAGIDIKMSDGSIQIILIFGRNQIQL